MSAPRSIFWSLSGQLGQTVASLASTVILARLLTPADYGAFAFATTIYALVQWLLQMGVGSYILREADLTRGKIETAIAACCYQGVTSFAIVIVAAPIAGLITGSATVGWVTAAVACVPLLSAPEAVADALWMRKGAFAKIAWLQVAKAAVQMAVSIGSEVAFHWGPYALVAGLVANGLTSALATFFALWVRQWLRPRRDPAHWRELRSFGGRSLLITLAQVGAMRVPDLLVGRLLSIATLGQYNRASNALDLIARMISQAVARAVAPRLFRRFNEGQPLPDAIADFGETMLFFSWPAVAGVAVLARPLIHLIYGPQWDLAADALPILCLIFAIDSARAGGTETFLIRDRLGANARLELARAVYAITLVVVGAHWGLAGVLWARVIESVTTLTVYLVAMARFEAIAWRHAWRVFGVNALLSVAAAGPALLFMQAWRWPQRLGFGEYVLTIGSGALCWLAAMALLGHPYLARGTSIARARLGRAAA